MHHHMQNILLSHPKFVIPLYSRKGKLNHKSCWFDQHVPQTVRCGMQKYTIVISSQYKDQRISLFACRWLCSCCSVFLGHHGKVTQCLLCCTSRSQLCCTYAYDWVTRCLHINGTHETLYLLETRLLKKEIQRDIFFWAFLL